LTWPEPSSKLSLEAYAQMARDELASLAASEDALPVLAGGTGVYVQSVLDGWDLTGTGTLRRSLERDFPRSDVQGAYHVIAELDRRYRLIEQARRPGRRRNVALETHGYREFVRAAAPAGKAIAELDGADLAAARAEALGHIRAYSRRQRSWFRKLGASRADHRSAAKVIVSCLL
jgi:tRNA A37 N6-isopentenylltransferase MiaA